jgi:rhodanese-related sulfurtransferase
MNWKRILIEALLLLAVAFLAGVASNSSRSEAHKLAWIAGYRTPEPGSRLAPARAPTVPAQPASAGNDLLSLAPLKDPSLIFLPISGEVALRLHNAGALFVDARRSTVYEQGHIEKALNIPVWEHDVEDRIAALPAQGVKPDQVMVIYCSGGNCEDGPRLSEKLALAGFFNVYLYKDGFPAALHGDADELQIS